MNDPKTIVTMKPVDKELLLELSNYFQPLAKNHEIKIDAITHEVQEDKLVVHLVGDISKVIILCQYLVGDYPHLAVHKEVVNIR